MASCNNDIAEEIEALQAIMMDEDELKVYYDENGQPNAVHLVIKPATAQNIEEQHVRVTLVVIIPPQYPDEPPTIQLRNPRGIDDDVLKNVHLGCIKKCEEFIGFPVIYELTELARERLTANNTPSCPCAICLLHFTSEDQFTKTECFHYFHSHCLGRYILNCEASAAKIQEAEIHHPIWMTKQEHKLLCPICREPMAEKLDGVALINKLPPTEEMNIEDFCSKSPNIVALQKKMNSLFLHQKAKGGIIDLEEEKNKFLITSSLSNEDDSVELVEKNKEVEVPKDKELFKGNNQNSRNPRKGNGHYTSQKKDNYHCHNNSKNKMGYKKVPRPKFHSFSKAPATDADDFESAGSGKSQSQSGRIKNGSMEQPLEANESSAENGKRNHFRRGREGRGGKFRAS